MKKTATVRRRPNLASRRKSGRLPGVIYVGGEWIGQVVKVISMPAWNEILKELGAIERFKRKLRKMAK